MTKQDITSEYAFDERQTNYYTDAGRYLGLIDKGHDEDGNILFQLSARGGYLESIVPELIAMTDEEAKDYLYHAVHSEEAKAFLKKRAEGGVTE